MKIVTVLVAVAALALTRTTLAEETELKTPKDKVSYIIGLNIARSLKEISGEVDVNILVNALKGELAGEKHKMTDDEMSKIMQTFQTQMQEKQMAKMKKDADDNVKKGEDFLAANKAKEGVKTTASGLQYQVLKEGAGDSPKPTDQVVVHYKGTLLDGTQFDSSYDRKEPATFGVNQVIPGWTEALQLMKPGAKFKLWIPSKIGYGERGTPGGPIGPNATLVFEVELLEIKK